MISTYIYYTTSSLVPSNRMVSMRGIMSLFVNVVSEFLLILLSDDIILWRILFALLSSFV